MTPRSRRILAALVTMLVLAGCGAAAETPEESGGNPTASAPTVDLTRYYRQSVRWSGSGCGEEGFRCASIKVPLDYADPGTADIELAVIRHRARSGERIGSLLVNPGGPGVSGVAFARAAEYIVSPEVLKSYDIVGFDPRGVVGSEPVDCVDDAQLDSLFAADATPDDQGEIDTLVAESAAVGKGCATRSPRLAPYLDSVSVARDMDILRAVLGDESLNFLGMSYGSLLGALYADLFPQQVGRVVLDGILPNSLDADQISHGQAVAFDVGLTRFVSWCVADSECPLPRDEQQGLDRISEFLESLDSAPLPGIGDRELTQALGLFAIYSHLYRPSSDWLMLEYGLAAAFDGDGSVLLDMVDDRTDRSSDGTFADNSNEAFYAVSCLDRPATGGVDEVQELAAAWAADAPIFGSSFAWGTLPCRPWPLTPGVVGGADPRSRNPVHAAGAAPILVVSTRYDTATPYQWGVQVADELATGELLTYEGDGHTAYRTGSPCIDKAVDAYLLHGAMPAQGATCPAIPVSHAK